MVVRALPAVLLKKSSKELNEDSRRTASDIQAVREWLEKQSHLASVYPSDQWLVAFLRGCKFSLERSKEKMDMYYTLRAVVPEFFANRDPMGSKIQDILSLGVFLPLKYCKDEVSPRINIIRVGQVDPSRFHLNDLIKVSIMVTEILMMEDDQLTVAGEEVIVDMSNVGMSVLGQWTPALAQKAITCFEKALPVRVKGNHILNTPPGFEAAYAVFKGFLGKKIKKRIHVHNKKYSNMYKAIPKSILPAEYGGSEGTLQHLTVHWKKKVESYRDWFLQQENERSDETKRADHGSITSSLPFGVEGSFRKLEFD